MRFLEKSAQKAFGIPYLLQTDKKILFDIIFLLYTVTYSSNSMSAIAA